MIHVIFEDGVETLSVSGLYQYDYNQYLYIEGLDLPSVCQVDFATEDKIGSAIPVEAITEDGITRAMIPNSLLWNEAITEDYRIYAFVYVADDDEGETVRKVKMKVKARPKADGSDTPVDRPPFSEAVEAVKEYADTAIQAKTDAASSAGTAERAAQTILNAVAEVAENARTVVETSEKVEEVSRVVNASAEASESAKTEAISAKNSAENARDEAVTASREANEAKEDAETAREEIREVEGRIPDFEKSIETVEKIRDRLVVTEAEEVDTDYTKILIEPSEEEIEFLTEEDLVPVVNSVTEAKKKAMSAETKAEEANEKSEAVAEDVATINNHLSALSESKLDKPEDAPVVGKILKIKAVNEDGSFVVEWGDAPSGGGISDVKIGEDSIVTDGIASIPVLTERGKNYGLVQVNNNTGLTFNNGSIAVATGSETRVNSRHTGYIATCGMADIFTKAGMSAPIADKAGSIDGVYHYPAWTEEEQANARERLGIISAEGVYF